MDVCKLLVHTLVMVRLDYCNALLCGAKEDVIRQLERLQRQAARVVCKKYKNDPNPVRSTRSSHKVNLLVVPPQKLNKYFEKAFAVVGPRLWNELLTDDLRGCNSVDTFKKKLKTILFQKTINIYYVLLYVLLIFRDYVEICNSSVDGFTQHVSYFCCTID